jgi:hypothetical protein
MSEPRDQLKKFNDLDIAAGCAAMLLHGPNAEDADLISSLAIAGLESGRHDGGQDPPWAELAKIIGQFRDGSRWDPVETSLVEPLAFYAGQFLLLTDGDPRNVFYLRVVLQAIFLGDGVGEEPLRADLRRLSRAVLRLSNHLIDAAGYERYEKAQHRSEGGPTLPEPTRFAELRSAVDMAEDRLAEVVGADPGILSPLVRDLDDEGPPPISSETGEPLLDLFPLVRRGERYVVSGPNNLAKALRHNLISTLIREGYRDRLAEQIWEVNLAECVYSAERMNWKLLDVEKPERDSGSCVGVAIFGFDSKAAAVTIVGDDLTSFDQQAPDGIQDIRGRAEEIEDAMNSAERVMLGAPTRPNELLHVVLLAGCGRSTVFGIGTGGSSLNAPRLLFGSESFSAISLAGSDECELWKFARASERLREGARVMPSDPLDEYAAWRDNRRSFYFGDDGRPTFVVFDSSHGRALREQVATERDIHPAHLDDQITEVMRLHDDPEIPIYIRVLDLGDSESPGPRQLVEADGEPIWVVGRTESENERRPYFEMVDATAYWVWQISSSLPEMPSALIQAGITLSIEVEDPAAWARGSVEDDDGPVATVETFGAGLKLTVHPVMMARLDRSDNIADRELAELLLKGFWDLSEAWGGEAPMNGAVAKALERHAPLGPKKKITLVSNLKEVALIDGPLPSYRPLQDADAEPLLDHAGELIGAKPEIQIGPIRDDVAGDVLNMVVADHFEQFSRMIATLSPNGLLEALVATHESAIHHEAVARMTFASKAACFGETRLVDDLVEEIPLYASTAIAMRFTIEYVVTRPPTGLRPLSRDFLDQILALAFQIANRGLISDVVTYELGDLELELLGSGRLGINRHGGYLGGQQSYLEATIPSQASAARESYGDLWEAPAEGRPPIADKLDVGARAEWGVSMTELAEFHGELVGAAMRRSMAVSSATRGELVAELVEALDLDQRKIEGILEMLSLVPRKDFLKPPKAYALPDIYPWRFNRELSYLRRPLLVRPSADGTRDADEILWGPRHVDASGKQLLTLVLSERLKASSTEMRNLMSELRQKETAGFVGEVGRRCREAGFVVRTNVDKVAGKKILKPNGDPAGDLDLVAANPAKRVLHIRECKDLEAARTPAETHNELERTFTVGGKKRSATDKHLDRIAWVDGNLDDVLDWLGLPGDQSEWRVIGGFVVDTELLSPYVYECPLPVTPLDRLISDLQALEDE